MPAINVKQVPYPNIPGKELQRSNKAFEITTHKCTLGVMYAIEPFQECGSDGVHISISKSSAGFARRVNATDVKLVKDVCEKRGLEIPGTFDKQRFEAGPFAGLGLHLWEATT